jgi:hypothetical protein
VYTSHFSFPLCLFAFKLAHERSHPLYPPPPPSLCLPLCLAHGKGPFLISSTFVECLTTEGTGSLGGVFEGEMMDVTSGYDGGDDVGGVGLKKVRSRTASPATTLATFA